MQSGFRDPVLDRDDVRARPRRRAGADARAARDRRDQCAGDAPAHADRRARFARGGAAYEVERRDDGLLPATWEVINALAWAPEPGTPIRSGGVDEVSVPVSKIRIRQRP